MLEVHDIVLLIALLVEENDTAIVEVEGNPRTGIGDDVTPPFLGLATLIDTLDDKYRALPHLIIYSIKRCPVAALMGDDDKLRRVTEAYITAGSPDIVMIVAALHYRGL